MIGPRGVELLQGESLTLFASAARATAVANSAGTAVFVGGERRRFLVVLDVTAAAAAGGEWLDESWEVAGTADSMMAVRRVR